MMAVSIIAEIGWRPSDGLSFDEWRASERAVSVGRADCSPKGAATIGGVVSELTGLTPEERLLLSHWR